MVSNPAKTITLSIVVPVKNGMKTLPNLLQKLQQQSIFSQIEMVIVDSGSQDGSVEYLQKFDFIRLFQIPSHEFNHGATRNFAVSQCEAEYVWMTVQDAWPTEHNMLEKAVQHFKDQNVVAVCGQQIVPQDPKMNPHEWFRSSSAPEIYKVHYNNTNYQNLTPKQKWEAATIDNVNTFYRRSSLKSFPFKPVFWGEDMYWGNDILAKGFAIVYDRSIKVFHYHHHDKEYTIKQTLITKILTYKCFKLIDSRTFNFKQYFLVVYRNLKWKQNLKWIPYNFRLIYNHRKATELFLKNLKRNTLESLEKEVYLTIPSGKQSE